jgi:flavin-dependent dehydrogenase
VEACVIVNSTFDNLHAAAAAAWDAAVIGAGPAGALAARQLALVGRRVLLVDRRSFPRDKVCGACVNGRAISVLANVGLSDLMKRLGAIPLHRFQLWAGGRTLALRLPAGVAVSRRRLDAEFVRAADAAGVAFLPGTTANVGDADERHRRVRLSSADKVAEIRAGVVIVADGLGHPSLAGRPEFQSRRTEQSRVGCGTCVDSAPASLARGVITMAVARGGYVGLVRQEDGSLNVAAALDPQLVRTAGGPGPLAVSVLEAAGAPRVLRLEDHDWYSTPLLTQRSERIFGRRLFLIGDAAGYIEPFTGEGIAWALESAAAVAPLADRAVAAWHDELGHKWQTAYAGIVESRQGLCRLLARAMRRPLLVRAGIHVASWMPSIAERLVAELNAPTALAASH